MIRDCQHELDTFFAETFPSKPPQERQTAPRTNEPPADDLDVVDRCQRFRNGARFERLMQGSTADYGNDASRADAALIEDLLWANGGDIEQAVRIASTSMLWREKWESKRGNTDWIHYTAERILAKMTSFSDPNRGRPIMPKGAVDLQPLQTSSNGAGVNGHDAVSHQSRDDLVCRPAAEWAVLEAENERLRTRILELEGLASTTSSIRRNKHLGSAKATAEALPHQIASLQEHAEPDSHGLYRVTLARIAEAAGVSESSASKHLRDLESKGLIVRKLQTVAKQRDGERPTVERELHIGLPADCTNVVDFAQRLAAANLEKNHGGKRERRCQHCDADLDTQGTKTTTTVECLSCHQVAEGDVVTRWTDRTGKRRVSRSALADDLPVVNEHDAISEAAAWEIVNTQLAPIKNVSTTEGDMPFLNEQDALSQNGQQPPDDSSLPPPTLTAVVQEQVTLSEYQRTTEDLKQSHLANGKTYRLEVSA